MDTHQDVDVHNPDESGACADPSCQMCGLDHPIEIPRSLVRDTLAGELVFFAGAGISTEAHDVFPDTVYERALSQLPDADVSEESTFPEVMQAFEDEYGRKNLARLILGRLDDVDGFRRAREMARSFHKELSTIPMVTDIITTNWDTYFEEECGATAFVTGEDTTLWNSATRRVLKLHGSVANLGTIIATSKDYDNRMNELSRDAVGAFLRTLLTTKSVVFIGYSLNDWTIRQIYTALADDIKSFAPKAFVVDPLAPDTFNDLGMPVLKTSGTGFVRQLKTALGEICVIPDRAFDQIRLFEDRIYEALDTSQSISHKQHPHVFFNWMFHDGARDACYRILHRKRTGEYSDRHRVTRLLRNYVRIQERAQADGNWEDFSYVEGYTTALVVLLSSGTEDDSEETARHAPVHFAFGSDEDIIEKSELIRALDTARDRHPEMEGLLQLTLAELPEDMVRVHGPSLKNLT